MSESATLKIVKKFQSGVIHILALFAPLKKLVDLDRDGDVDTDDIIMLYNAMTDCIERLSSTVAEWATLDEGGRINLMLRQLKEHYPGVDSRFWLLVNSVLWAGAAILKKYGVKFALSALKIRA